MILTRLTKVSEIKALTGPDTQTLATYMRTDDDFTVWKLETVLQWLKDKRCKATNEIFFYASGALINDFIFKKAPEQRDKSFIKDESIFLFLKLPDMEVEYDKVLNKNIHELGFDDFTELYQLVADKAGVLEMLLNKTQLKQYRESHPVKDEIE